MRMEQTECSETSAYKIQTPWNYPEESIQHSEHGESQHDDDPTGSKHAAVWIFYEGVFDGYLFTPLRSNYSVTAFVRILSECFTPFNFDFLYRTFSSHYYQVSSFVKYIMRAICNVHAPTNAFFINPYRTNVENRVSS